MTDTQRNNATANAKAEGATVVLFRAGDFWEVFGGDAKRVAGKLGLPVTTRHGSGLPYLMAGFPYHQFDAYHAKLLASGERIATVDA